MFKVVKKRDFVRAQTSFDDHFVITRRGVPQGLYLSVERMKIMHQQEISDFLHEVLTYLGVFDEKEGD